MKLDEIWQDLERDRLSLPDIVAQSVRTAIDYQQHGGWEAAFWEIDKAMNELGETELAKAKLALYAGDIIYRAVVPDEEFFVHMLDKYYYARDIISQVCGRRSDKLIPVLTRMAASRSEWSEYDLAQEFIDLLGSIVNPRNSPYLTTEPAVPAEIVSIWQRADECCAQHDYEKAKSELDGENDGAFTLVRETYGLDCYAAAATAERVGEAIFASLKHGPDKDKYPDLISYTNFAYGGYMRLFGPFSRRLEPCINRLIVALDQRGLPDKAEILRARLPKLS